MKTALGVLTVVLLGLAWILLLVGIGFSVGGVRVVVSNRLDERSRAFKSLKTGVSLLAAGGILMYGASWLADWIDSL